MPGPGQGGHCQESAEATRLVCDMLESCEPNPGGTLELLYKMHFESSLLVARLLIHAFSNNASLALSVSIVS